MSDLFKTNVSGFDQHWLETKMIRQSLIFYNEMLPVVFQCCAALWRGKPLNLCDIGANSGAGGAHLHDCLNNLTGYKVTVTGFDTDARYAEYAKSRFSQIEFVGGDFFDDDRRFDISTCSHTLEHIPQPEKFVSRVLDRLDGAAIFYVPYEEQKLIPGHVNRFTTELLRTMPGIVWASVVNSIGWRTEGDRSRCVMFVCLPEHRLKQADLVATLQAKLSAQIAQQPLQIHQVLA